MRTGTAALSTAALALLVLCASKSGCRADRQRNVLGGVDLDAFCKSKGNVRSRWMQDPAQFGGKRTWGCEDSDGAWLPLSIAQACTAQYDKTAHGEQEREDDAASWVCVEGPAPATPAPQWNTANL